MASRKQQNNLWEVLGYPKTISVRVTPNASRSDVRLDTLKTEERRVRIYVTTTPENGKANKVVLSLLAKVLHVPISSLQIIQGETSRDKVIAVDALSPQEKSLTTA
ncbi:MAG: DUF167 domain-containing protein [Alphaproteobacteria bacterium]|nr:DUF167 domain-containing protein [Alphaproteobacteria bacterium]